LICALSSVLTPIALNCVIYCLLFWEFFLGLYLFLLCILKCNKFFLMYDIYENKRYRDNFKIKSNIQLRVEYFKSSGKKQAVKMIFYFRCYPRWNIDSIRNIDFGYSRWRHSHALADRMPYLPQPRGLSRERRRNDRWRLW